MEKLIALVVVLAFLAILFRYEISTGDTTAYLLDRWTGELEFIAVDERIPVKPREKNR